MTDKETYTELDATVVRQTPKAILLDIGNKETWVPKSVMSHSDREFRDWDIGDNVLVKIAEWFTKKKDL